MLSLGRNLKKTPAFFSLINYADISLGTWYPSGGMNQLVHAVTSLAKSLGVIFLFNRAVQRIEVESGKVKDNRLNGSLHCFDYIIASADYHHVEQDFTFKISS